LIVDAIATQEKIDVSDDEVGARVGEMVTRSGRQRERVAEFYAKEENRAALKDAMRREKTLTTLLERAQSEPETVPAAEQSGTPSSETPANG
jgi:FKBP-type peptidyl-prolyl cis-trans isomerase (trigger factor)